MKRSSKYLLIATALVAASGIAIASPGGHSGQGGVGQGYGHGGMQGMHQMMGKHGMGGGMMSGGMGGVIYQLDNLTDDQKQQIAALRQEQHTQMFNLREQMLQQRGQMKQKILTILTDEQRTQLEELRPNH
ncbi:MAG: hypothetical protein OEY09_01385 [Gammaproteobacteria bacterium]|nr:hypothetical protein [Gammaproteobacteria bacterium]